MLIKHHSLALAYQPLRLYNSILKKVSRKQGGRLRVLLYHDVAPLDKDKFAAQLNWLSHTWNFVSPEEFTSMQKGDLPVLEDSLMLTFDDGFYSNRQIAESVLNPMGIKALFFIVSEFSFLTNLSDMHGFISKNICPGMQQKKIPPHLQSMSIDDLTYLLDTGHTVGAHTANHARLCDVPKEKLRDEVIISADNLESKLGCKIKHFAYTFGDLKSFSPEALNIARTRFDCIYTGLRGFNSAKTPCWAIRRDSVTTNNSFSLIGAFLEGAADSLYKNDLAVYESWGGAHKN